VAIVPAVPSILATVPSILAPIPPIFPAIAAILATIPPVLGALPALLVVGQGSGRQQANERCQEHDDASVLDSVHVDLPSD
jgi:hypothetical protein